jgi:hypothetical protein
MQARPHCQLATPGTATPAQCHTSVVGSRNARHEWCGHVHEKNSGPVRNAASARQTPGNVHPASLSEVRPYVFNVSGVGYRMLE